MSTPPDAVSCNALTSAAIQAVIERIGNSLEKAASDVDAQRGTPGENDNAAKDNLAYLTQARDKMQVLLDFLYGSGFLGRPPDPPAHVTDINGAYNIHGYVREAVEFLHHARHWAAISASRYGGINAKESYELTTQALELIEPLGAAAGRCYIFAGTPESPVSPEQIGADASASCPALTSAAIQAIIGRIGNSLEKAASDVEAQIGTPGENDNAAKDNLAYLTQGRDKMQAVLDFLYSSGVLGVPPDPPPYVRNISGALNIHGYVRETVVFLHHARHWATISASRYKGVNARESYELTTQALELIEPLGAAAGRCYLRYPIVFTAPIVTGGLAALGGYVTVTINLDGSVRWQGHAHNSGLDGYDFGIAALVRSTGGRARAIALAHSGHVGGTITAGSRDDDWDEVGLPRSDISKFLADYYDGSLEIHLEYESNIGSAFENLISWLVKFSLGSVLGPSGGVVVFVGIEIGSLISTGSLVPGAVDAGGILWMAGPHNTLYALIAEGIASIGSRTGELKEEQYNWANEQVFRGSLPPRDRLVLTDTLGPGSRAFTFPRFDGKITLNMGPDAFDDPRLFPGKEYGEIFIHELVHACQIQHTNMDIALLADALSNKICEVTGDPYKYGPAGPPFSDFNLEQQAQIVSDWFIKKDPADPKHPDENSPYFRYIQENVRTGNL